MKDERAANIIKASSKSTGVSIVRERNGNIRIVPTYGEKDKIVKYDIIEDEADPGIGVQSNCAYDSSISCGGLPSSGNGALPPVDKRLTWPGKPAVTLRDTTVPPPIEPEVCPVYDLIVATGHGYYGIIIGLENPITHYWDTTIAFLGNNPAHKCIVENIGRVEFFNIPGFTANSQPSRWAYVDGVRKHALANEPNLWTGMPMVTGTVLEDFTENHYNVAVFTPHYGYGHGDRYTRSYRGLANVGGCAVNGDVLFFGRTTICISINGIDWELFDSPGWDWPDYNGVEGSRGARWMENIGSDIACSIINLASDDVSERIRNHVNFERHCTILIDELDDDIDADSIASTYAVHMAANSFLSHQDPLSDPPGAGIAERMIAGGIDDYVAVGEVLVTVPPPDPPLSTVIEEKDYVCDRMWEAWEASEVHYLALIDKTYYRAGFAISYDAETSLWYGCGVLYSLEGDEPDEIITSQLQFPDPPVVKYTDHEFDDGTLMFPSVWHRGTGFRAYATYPRENIGISCMARSVFEGTWAGLGTPVHVREKCFEAYTLLHNDVLRNEQNDELEPFPETDMDYDNPYVYDWSWLTTGGWIRPVNYDPAPEEYNFWIQKDGLSKDYDATYSRELKVVLTALGEDPMPGATPEPDPLFVWDPYVPSLERVVYFRHKPELEKAGEYGLLEDEIEPDWPTTDPTVGGCQLYLGNLLIDDANRLGCGNYFNPFRNIMVGSIFHTNSGYTALTYTMPKLLNQTYREWNSPDVGSGEYYWWNKLEYWAAIIDPYGNRIARWKLYVAPPEYTANGIYYATVIKTQNVVAPTQTYHEQFSGLMEKENVYFYATINGEDFILVDNGEGEFYEPPDQISGHVTVLASSVINYASGTVDLVFGPEQPDTYSDVTFKANVYDCDYYVPLEIFEEFALYKDNEIYYNIYQLSGAGVHPLQPNLTITEDGHYAIFSCKSAYKVITAQERLYYGNDISLTGVNTFNNNYGLSNTQMIVFDLWDISVNVPKRVSDPLFTGNTIISDVMVLN